MHQAEEGEKQEKRRSKRNTAIAWDNTIKRCSLNGHAGTIVFIRTHMRNWTFRIVLRILRKSLENVLYEQQQWQFYWMIDIVERNTRKERSWMFNKKLTSAFLSQLINKHYTRSTQSVCESDKNIIANTKALKWYSSSNYSNRLLIFILHHSWLRFFSFEHHWHGLDSGPNTIHIVLIGRLLRFISPSTLHLFTCVVCIYHVIYIMHCILHMNYLFRNENFERVIIKSTYWIVL